MTHTIQMELSCDYNEQIGILNIKFIIILENLNNIFIVFVCSNSGK